MKTPVGKRLFKAVILFLIGGALYLLIEAIWRAVTHAHPTHWAMLIVGGNAFLLIGAINEYFPWDLSIWVQCLIGGLLVTLVEFVSGLILNYQLRLDIWDYSGMPLNLMGQICLPLSVAWVGLSLLGILLDDFLRWQLFGESRPCYNWSLKLRRQH